MLSPMSNMIEYNPNYSITVKMTKKQERQWDYTGLYTGVTRSVWTRTMLDLATCERPGIITLPEIDPTPRTIESPYRFTVYGDSVNFNWWKETALATRFPRSVRDASRRLGWGERYLLECWAEVTLDRAARDAVPMSWILDYEKRNGIG